MAPESAALLQRLASLDSTVVSDALDGLGLPAGLEGLRPAWGAPRIVGRARTVALESDRGQAPGTHLATSVVATAQAGDVIVVANGGRLDVSCWGGILSLGSIHRGVAGVIADGACRDVAEAQQHGLPVFSRGVSPRTGRGRLRQRATAVRVQLGDVPVDEGDLVIADDSGVVFVPLAHADAVLTAAEAVQAREAAIAADILRGVPIDRAMHDARLAGHQHATDETGRRVEHTMDQTAPDSALDGLATATISDALDKLGLPGSLHGIAPLRGGQRACGPAYTVRYEPVDEQPGTVGDFLDDVPAGSVVVIDNAGRTDCTVWGGIMTRVAAHRDVAATVINGVCRDTEVSSSAGYPIWSAGRFMRTGKDRVRLRSLREPVVIDGVTIRAGDVVCCDEDGVVVVPAEHVAEVGRIAEHIDQVEASIVEAVLGGSSLAEARAAQGYHVLQTPSASSGGAA
jgi:regulator of RNase E activity RraA